MPSAETLAAAERLGHRLEALAPPQAPPPIQRTIYRTDKDKEHKKPFKSISQSNPYLEMDETGKAWFHKYHNDTTVHFTVDELQRKIEQHKNENVKPPSIAESIKQAKATRKKTAPKTKTRKKKATDSVFVPVPRQTKAFVGTQVDYSKDPQFRTERRIIRRLRRDKKSVGDKNIYTKRFKFNDRKIKLATVSIPPSDLPKGYEKLPFEEVVNNRLGQGSHSEGVTDKIEKNVPLFREMAKHEHYSASSREQCEKCRYNFPPVKKGSHKFGTFYSGTTDHIEDPKLRKKLIKNNGKVDGLKLSPKEKEEATRGRLSAATARQEFEDQNPLLNQQRKEISTDDSEGEHSSDDDELYVTDDLAWKDPLGWGKNKKKVNVIPRRSFFTSKEIEEVERKTKVLIEKKKKKKEEMERKVKEEKEKEKEEVDMEDEGDGESDENDDKN